MSVTLPSYTVAADLMPFGNSLISWLWPVLVAMGALAFGPKVVSALKSGWNRVVGRRS
jgi:hypothetical protein